MNHPLICMTLTGRTLEEDMKLVKKYDKQIDLVELRVDYLNEDEQLYVKRFPSMISKPCILTIRRDIDGGQFRGSEFSRTNLFGRALAFADPDKTRNFAFVDFEDDYHIPSMQDAAMAFGVRVIRSQHFMDEPVLNIRERCNKMRKTGYEIPKIAFKPNTLSDVLNLFSEGMKMTSYDHILCAMGPIGVPSRILSGYTNSFLTYVTPQEKLTDTSAIGHLDPITLNDVYNFRRINDDTKLFGITGWPLEKTSSPELHNFGYKKCAINGVYLPVKSQSISEAIHFCERMNFKGLSVTVPHKEAVLYYLNEQSPEVIQIGACNTVVFRDDRLIGYNTDASGFGRALLEFLGNIRLKRMKVAVIGAGGAAKAIVYTLKQFGAKVCIFNRSLEHAAQLADKYGFEYAALEPKCIGKLDEYSSLIIQTTSVGMNSTDNEPQKNDPIYFYDFRGNEMVFDLIYTPQVTPVMRRAEQAGCRTCNGYKMLEYQAYEQFKLFTAMDLEKYNN